MHYSKIVSTGHFLPKNILTNQDLERLIDTSDDWITIRTGIKSRHIVSDETVADMGYYAALEAIDNAKIDPNEIDLIIVATTSGSHAFPSSACLIQTKLGIEVCTSFDVAAACTGFVYALEIANQFISSGKIKKALVIGADALSTTVNKQDRSTVVLFGDGAGAIILEASSDKNSRIIDTYTRATTSNNDCLVLPNRPRQSDESAFLEMQGNILFKIAVNELAHVTEHILKINNLTANDVDWLIPHQANLRIIKATAKKLNLGTDKLILTVTEHGNTSAASIILALHQGIIDGRVKRGNTLLLESFGGGLTSGSALIKY
ncbi:MAG: beta-ketoacyl-ACP synthase III [Psittacicella sp.]